jgi:hypothetical protein
MERTDEIEAFSLATALLKGGWQLAIELGLISRDQAEHLFVQPVQSEFKFLPTKLPEDRNLPAAKGDLPIRHESLGEQKG